MLAAAFVACGLDWRYSLSDVAASDLPRVVAQLHSGELRGANVTQPHKAAVLPLLDELSEDCVRVEAVNTVVRLPDGRLRGETTDLPALADELDALAAARVRDPAERDESRRGTSSRAADPAQRDELHATALSRANGPAQRDELHATASSRANGPAQRDPAAQEPSAPFRRAVILGRGGAARTAAAALQDRGAEVVLIGRDEWAGLEPLLAGADLLINATPIGTGGADAPIPKMMLRRELAVLDLVYRPSPTDLIAKAREAGAPARGGAGMLLGQAARSFTLWTGLEAPVGAMRDALRAELGAGADV
jgi:shikimate 5-dehydrogenase